MKMNYPKQGGKEGCIKHTCHGLTCIYQILVAKT
jgi:hypothetical protein